MAIRRSDKARLARLAGPRLWEERRVVEERVKLRDRVHFCLRVGLLLTIEGVDPETTCIMARLREAEAELDAIPDTPELEQADDDYLAREDPSWIDDWRPRARYQPPPREEKTAKGEIERLMGRFRTDCKDMDITKHSPFELYAWCLSRQQGESYDEAAAAAAKAGEKAAKDLLLFLDTLPDDPSNEDLEHAISPRENQ